MVELEQNLGDLNGQNGFALVGINRGDRLGFAVSIIGDINGDGIDDAAFGAIDDGPSGAVHVVFGQPGGFPTTVFPSQLNGTNGLTLRRSQPVGRLGFSVSGAGDLNNDGISDLIIGAPAANPQGEFDISGASYVVFGRRDGSFPALVDVDQLNGQTGFAIAGAVGDRAGQSVSEAGDLNGDRIPDFIIGAPGNNRAYVVYGQPGQQTSSLNLAALTPSQGVVLNGTTDDFAGTTVRNIGDFNGDGFDDVAIAAPLSRRSGTAVEQQARQEGKVYVVFGSAALPAQIDLTQLNGQNGFAFQGNGTGSSLVGSSVDGAGDVNGDGLADLIIGARGAVNQGGGQAYVLYGQRSPLPGLIDRDSLNGQTGFTLNGTPDPGGFFSRGEQAGAAVAGIGDYNQDGLDDVLVYAPQGDANGRSDVGRSYVVYGQQNAAAVRDLGNLNQANGFVINGIANFDGDGLQLVQQDGASGRVDGGGDLNGDRVPDLLIGNPVADRTALAPSSGFGYVVFNPTTARANPTSPAPSPIASTPAPVPATPPSDTFSPADPVSPAPALSVPRFIPGTPGNDRLQGGDGDDTLAAPLGNNWLLGGDGDDLLVTNLGSDRLDGGDGDDLMAAGEDNDLLLGGAGDDVLLGNAGDDWLAGNDGDDLLFGGAGRDRLRGGDGNDIFVLGPGQGRDIILDFELGRDRILLTGGLNVTDLELRGNTIRFQGETLAILDRVFNLIAVDFI